MGGGMPGLRDLPQLGGLPSVGEGVQLVRCGSTSI